MLLGPIWWPAETLNLSLPGLLDLYFLHYPNLSYGFWLDFSYLIRLRRSATVAAVLRFLRAVHHRDLTDQGSYPLPSVTIVGALFAIKTHPALGMFQAGIDENRDRLGDRTALALQRTRTGAGQIRIQVCHKSRDQKF